MKSTAMSLANQYEFVSVNSLGKGEVVSSILTGSTINLQAFSMVSCRVPRNKRMEPVMNKSATTQVQPPSASNKTSGGDWQPIETAPKDGVRILACWAKHAPEFVGYGVVIWDAEACSWMEAVSEAVSRPTHWMPLPEPPTSSV